jgi:hypothetical protein
METMEETNTVIIGDKEKEKEANRKKTVTSRVGVN